MNDIIVQLDNLAEIKATITLIEAEKKKMVEQVLTQEIKDKLADIDAKFANTIEAGLNSQREIEDGIKAAVLKHGESVKGDNLHAVFSKPRTSWDTKGLNGYATAYPEILQFKKTGKPSVSIRAI